MEKVRTVIQSRSKRPVKNFDMVLVQVISTRKGHRLYEINLRQLHNKEKS